MRAVVWHGKEDMRVDTVPDPTIEDPRDCIIRVTSTAICGSDLHLYDGYMPTMKSGDIVGHEPMGIVEEVGSSVKKLKKGDRVVVPFCIACGECRFCKLGLFSACGRSNPNAELAEKMMGHAPAGLFGYSALTGAYPGGQAEYLRVPYADVGPLKIESDLPDERVLFLSDIFPTGYFAADIAGIEPGDTVAIWGAGPVGLMAAKSAWMLGAGRVVVIDRVPERLAMAKNSTNSEIINFDDEKVKERLDEMTGGDGPDRCIDAVGCEAHAHGSIDAVIDKVKAEIKLGTDRAHVLREAIINCRKGGTVSVPGVYVGLVDKVPIGAAMNKGLTLRMGQCPVHKYNKQLLQRIEKGDIDPSFVISHTVPLEKGPEMYKTFRDKKDNCIKVVLKPFA